MLKDIDFYHFRENLKKQLLYIGLDASKKVVPKADDFLENKIAGTVTKSNDDNIEKQEPVEEIIILPKKREEILTKSRKVF